MASYPFTEYGNFRNTPIQKHYFEFTLNNYLGDVTGKSVLDLGCCEGYYCRMFKEKGATQVVGVDVCEDMMGEARNHEVTKPVGIEYVNSDVAEFRHDSKFDVVTMMLLINRAKDVSHLQAMCRVAFQHLKPGGRLIAIFTPNHKPGADYDFRPLGFTVNCMLQSDAISRVYFSNDFGQDPVTSFFNLFERVTIVKIFTDEGFRQLEFRHCDASPFAHSTEELWNALYKARVFRGLTCKKEA